MAMDPEALYVQLGHLIAEMPNLRAHPLPQDAHRWLGRAFALVQAGGDYYDIALMKVKIAGLNSDRGMESERVAQDITSILYQTLAVAELNAPNPVRGSFIPAGNLFDALAAFSKVLLTATNSVLIVDPYMDEKALTDFAVLLPEHVLVRLLADQKEHKASLKPAAARWITQHGSKRPLEAKLAPRGSLHDRLIFIDGSAAWALTQSLNAFAARSPASILRVEPEVAALKVTAYERIWQSASPL